jgi:hypothetical protein
LSYGVGPVASRILIDLAPLRASRSFRLLFAGQMVSVIGSQFTVVAVAYQVYLLTGSSLQFTRRDYQHRYRLATTPTSATNTG